MSISIKASSRMIILQVGRVMGLVADFTLRGFLYNGMIYHGLGIITPLVRTPTFWYTMLGEEIQ